MLPNERQDADINLNSIIYELLANEEWQLACVLGEFSARAIKTHHSEELRRMMLVNLAQGYKWSGQHDECEKVISNEDWSATGHSFQLAVAVLRTRIDDATRLMRQTHGSGEIKCEDYRDWPLFREFRETEGFRSTYRELFGSDFFPSTPHANTIQIRIESIQK